MFEYGLPKEGKNTLKDGEKSGRCNVIVEIQKDGKNFVVGLELSSTFRGVEVNDIRGLLPKDNAEWLNWIHQGKLVWRDKEKIQDLINKQRTNPAEVEYLDLDEATKINNNFENRKLLETEIAESLKEMSEIVERAKADGTYMKAPNGEPSNLNEHQWAQTRTSFFNKWFGDWENDTENASRFVDENGEPKVFYHNTDEEFTACDTARNGTNTDAGWLGDGLYFYGDVNEGNVYGKNKMAVYLNSREIYIASPEENARLSDENSREASIEFTEELKDEWRTSR